MFLVVAVFRARSHSKAVDSGGSSRKRAEQ